MLNLINILTLSTALSLQPIENAIVITISGDATTYNVSTKSEFVNEEDKPYTFDLYFYNDTTNFSITFNEYTQTKTTTNEAKTTRNKIAIGYERIYSYRYDITRFIDTNNTENLQSKITIFTNSIQEFNGNNTYSIDLNIERKTFMEELLTALTTAVQSAVSIFVEGFGGLTQIFYNGTEITFIGGVLIVGLAVMFLMMFLRWIVSFVKGI